MNDKGVMATAFDIGGDKLSDIYAVTDEAKRLQAECLALLSERDQLRVRCAELYEANNQRNAAHVATIQERDQLRAEVEALRKDVGRWRYARSILTVEAIETAQSDFVNFGLPPAESESIRADQAIDAAMAAKKGGAQ